jgi:hypothetical protein
MSEIGLKQCDAAIQHAREALVIFKASFGLEHGRTAVAYYALGRAYDCAKQIDAAEAALHSVIEIEARLEHPTEYRGEHLRAYAHILRTLHRDTEAKEYDSMAAAVEASGGRTVSTTHVVDVMELRH